METADVAYELSILPARRMVIEKASAGRSSIR